MDENSLAALVLVLANGLFTYRGFKDPAFFESYIFEVDKVLIGREYKRLLSSAFLHANWWHFGLNMIALWSFATLLELVFGPVNFLLLYFLSLLGGNLLALYFHRHHGDYRAVGASGAVSGVVLASIVLFPEGNIGFVFIPLDIPAWIFGLLFVLISIFGIKNQSGNIGHEAHLGGGIIGVLLSFIFSPSEYPVHFWIAALILLPSIAFLILIARNPAVLMVENYWGENLRSPTKKSKKEKPGKSRQEELNELLEKIKQEGMESLSKKEKSRLEELTKEL